MVSVAGVAVRRVGAVVASTRARRAVFSTVGDEVVLAHPAAVVIEEDVFGAASKAIGGVGAVKAPLRAVAAALGEVLLHVILAHPAAVVVDEEVVGLAQVAKG